eukprot:TRINITY_DN102209_c0_g1_i1.p1 TRINITY_DN102209_c0_g1~~TRINITY_DN102209_c0_g1_i1.p1  ORF type:complete len:216 (+),score=44.20 TRINITY_DN102209_c0_g1_i1:58-705(+)
MAVPAASSDGAAQKRPMETGYGDGTDYWNKRYRSDTKPFEWLQGFAALENLIKEACNRKLDAAILHVGCGNSLLPEDMYDHGFKDITNIDTAEVCIQQMASRNKDKRPLLKWLEMDATSMGLSESSFECVIDKSVLDTFACGKNAANIIAGYLGEVERVLRPGGMFLCISYGEPSSRMEFLRQPNLSFSVNQVPIPVNLPGGKVHYAYMCKKGGK